MIYKVIGLMSGSSLDGLDIAYVHLQERSGKWEYQFVHVQVVPYPAPWRERLAAAPNLSARDYLLLHTDYGHWLGVQVKDFIAAHGLDYQVQLIASHGHTVFHLPARKMTAQLGDGAALAADTGINVVSDLRAMDIALGGQGAPIVPAGERSLFAGYELFLNLGGIANISKHAGRTGPGAPATGGAALPAVQDPFVAFDVCPANRILNLLAAGEGKSFDEGGALAASGRVEEALLDRLNALSYYDQAYPKSLGNEFGTDTVYPMIDRAIREKVLGTADALRTYTEHIAVQVREAVALLQSSEVQEEAGIRAGTETRASKRMLVTGGGAHNDFLVNRLRALLEPLQVELILPEKELIDFKEALIMALLGVLRWREENNALASVTGARRDSTGGAVWMGQEI